MSIIKAVNETNHQRYDTEDSVCRLIYYIFNDCKTSCDDIRPGKAIGDFVGCFPFMGSEDQEKQAEWVVTQMLVNNRSYGQFFGNLLKHRVVSLPNCECILPGEALELARYLAEAYGENYITAYGVHLDTKNIHIHLAIDAVSWKNGRRFSISYELKWLYAMVESWSSRRLEELSKDPKRSRRCDQYYGYY